MGSLSEWLKIMLDEVARKQDEAARSAAELKLREAAQSAPDIAPRKAQVEAP